MMRLLSCLNKIVQKLKVTDRKDQNQVDCIDLLSQKH